MLKLKKKRVIVATALLLLSAVLLTSASFAWFAMNTRVSADDFQVEAYTDSQFLQIKKADGAYGNTSTSISYNADLKPLKLVTNKTLELNDIIYQALTFTEVTGDDTYYDGATAYYKRVDSDADSTNGVATGGAYNYIQVSPEELESATDLSTLYTGIVFEEMVSGKYPETSSPVFFKKAEKGNSFIKATDLVANASLKGYYALKYEGDENMISTGVPNAIGTPKADAQYFEKSGDDYVKVDSPTSTNGLYEIKFVVCTDTDGNGDGTTYYYTKDASSEKYSPAKPSTETVLNGTYYKMQKTDNTDITDNAPVAISNAYTSGNASTVYWTKDDNGNYSVAQNISLGTNMKGYYTLTNLATEGVTITVEDNTKFLPGIYYYVANQLSVSNETLTDYACIGVPTPADTNSSEDYTKAVGYTYWGRAYSTNLEDVQAENTLNVLSEAVASADYYLTETFNIRQASNTDHAKNLRVSKVTVSGQTNSLTPALRVLMVAESESGEVAIATYDPGNGTNEAASLKNNGVEGEDGKLFDILLGDEKEEITVKVYIYFDGTDAVAMNASLSAGELNGQTISIEFAIDELDYNKVN